MSIRCVAFWFKVLTNPLHEGRILVAAPLEAIESGGSWIIKLRECLKSFGWQGIGMEEVNGLSSGKIRAMLETSARRRIESEWSCELDTKSKLSFLRLLKEKLSESQCLDVASKRVRRVMMRLRGGTASLRIESGQWQGLPREERTCQESQLGEVEDVGHWLFFGSHLVSN